MPDEIYGFTLEQIQRLSAALRIVEGSEPERPNVQSRGRPMFREDTIFGTLDGAASATTALTGNLKSATMSVYSFTSTGGTTDTGRNEEVWNAAKMQAVTGRWTVARRISANSRYVITFQSASTTGCT